MMMTPAQLLNSSATRYQQALSNVLKFWHVNGECKYCSQRADIKQLIEQQIVISDREVKRVLVQN